MRWTKPVLTIAFSGLASAFGQTAPPAAQQTPAIRGASAAGQFVVVLDAAHGGGDAGASLGRG